LVDIFAVPLPTWSKPARRFINQLQQCVAGTFCLLLVPRELLQMIANQAVDGRLMLGRIYARLLQHGLID
jgi:hypothetical protein